jgi:DnaJ-class molecular chaperone
MISLVTLHLKELVVEVKGFGGFDTSSFSDIFEDFFGDFGGGGST